MSAAEKKLRRVALLVESAQYPRRRMLAGVARYMHEHEPWLIYLKPVNVEKSLSNWLLRWHGDGVIAAVAELDVQAVTRAGIPIVDIVGLLHPSDVPLVHTNDRSVGRLAAEHLLERGFKNFAFLEYPFFWSADRRQGFEQALHAHSYKSAIYKLPFPAAGSGGPDSWENQQQSLVAWIRTLPTPVGVMASTDLCGQQFLEACQRAGVVVPEQIAVIGADNDETLCNLCFPPMSSVIINDAQRGYEAAAVLDKLMSNEPAPATTVYIEPSGVVARASTDILAIDDEPIVAALRFVRDNACNGINVEDVVRAVPLSRTVLERRFRKVVGRTINNEIVRVRLNRAVELLSETQLQVKSVAQRAGFGSTSYMVAVFREKLGRTPGSYRLNNKATTAPQAQGPLPEG